LIRTPQGLFSDDRIAETGMFERFCMGVCYYPEHWPASRLASDFARMKQNGFDLVRMGEGAWSVWEPREGEYQFDLFDRAIDLCRANGIQVILGTPTYCAPAWVADKYPDVLRWDFGRTPMAHGSRRNLNYTSASYLGLSDRLCNALAEHYRNEKQVIGWQLDNEFNCHMDVSYAPSDTLAFRRWLQRKYGTLARLNRAWGTRFWSQTYDDWDQLNLPHPTAAMLNPSQLLDESRFISDCVVRFARRQAAILRRYNKRWIITHNGLFPNVDGPRLAGVLDFFSHDQYPLFFDDWPARAEGLATARSLSFPFAIMEQQTGPGGQMSYLQRTPRTGELALWGWQSVAHGAGLLSFFRWRTCPYGSEQHWHGLLDQDNKDTRRLSEIKALGGQLRRLPRDFFAAPPLKLAAVLRDFDNEVNERRINTYTKPANGEHARWLAALGRRHIPADYLWPDSPLAGYRILIAPHMKIVTPQLVGKLRRFVQGGGTLVLGAQAGLMDIDCHIVERTPPGLLAELAGVEIEDWTTLPAGAVRTAKFADGAEMTMCAFVERLRLRGAVDLAHWNGPDTLLGNAPAIGWNRLGKGNVFYIGGYCSEESIARFLERLAHPPIDASDQIESIFRIGKLRTYLVLLNHSAAEQLVRGLPAGRELLRGARVRDQLSIPGLGVAVVRCNGRPPF
jgi:beta-galactosidase